MATLMIRNANYPTLIKKAENPAEQTASKHQQPTVPLGGLDGFATAYVHPDYPYVIHEAITGLTSSNTEVIKPPKGWYTDNADGQIKVVAGIQDKLSAEAKEAFALPPLSPDHTNLYTYINTEPNTLVNIRFDVFQQSNDGHQNTLQLLINGETVNQTSIHNINGFYQQTVKTIGTGQPIRIEFKTAKNNSADILLDNISIEPSFLNQAPIAKGDQAVGTANQALTLNFQQLFANDTDPDHDSLYAFSVQDAINGTASIVGQNVIFTPNKDYAGPASFTYTITDGKGAFSKAPVNITVKPPAHQAQLMQNHHLAHSLSSLHTETYHTDVLASLIILAAVKQYLLPSS